MSDYWAENPLNREQMSLFHPTLDAMIPEDDPVRLFDEVLEGTDWSEWEGQYHGKCGQPPIHPRLIAGAILYGLCRGIRSSRKLEEACHYRLDFMWLVYGRKIDHSTFSKFRTKFHDPLKNLFKQIGRIAMTLGLIRLAEVAFDGTRVKANNSRYATRTTQKLEEQLAALDELFEKMTAEIEANDSSERQQTLSAEEDSPTRLPAKLADLEQRRQAIQEALDKAKAADELRCKQGVKKPVQIPKTDSDSRVMPNKEGGYAPNYTPTVTTDGHRGFIVDDDVTNETNESQLAVPSVDCIEETFGEKPKKFLTDAGNNSGHVMHEMEERGVEFYAPAESNQPQEGNPAKRDDPSQPVPEALTKNLPLNNRKKFSKSCFVYDAKLDLYYCPQGYTMPFEKSKPGVSGGVKMTRRVYRCDKCDGCSLVSLCVDDKSKGGRTITRDEYEDVRERTASRMSTTAAGELYNRRPQIAETPFGILKSVMRLRQFLLRGLEKVQVEWRWATTAFNLGKLVREIARLRAEFTRLAFETES